jgi:predicted nucleic acid-binding protein
MTDYVVDAGVAVKWLVGEAYSEEAASLLDGESRLLGPELLFAEVTNALWALCRRGDISHIDFAEAARLLKAAPLTVPVSMRELTPSAARLAADLAHPAYDCFYLALARRADADVLVTTDRDFERLCDDESFEYVNPVPEQVLSEFEGVS